MKKEKQEESSTQETYNVFNVHAKLYGKWHTFESLAVLQEVGVGVADLQVKLDGLQQYSLVDQKLILWVAAKLCKLLVSDQRTADF